MIGPVEKSFLQTLRVFSITGEIDSEVAQKFKDFLRSLTEGTLAFRIRLESPGGNRASRILMTRYIVLAKQKGLLVFTEGKEMSSEAFNLFLMGNHRIADSNPVARPHLPESKTASPRRAHEIKQQTARFISAKTKLSEDQVFSLNLQPLPVTFLVENGIAHQILDLDFD